MTTPLSRHSARDFRDQPISTATLKAILTAAQAAPSWENTQPVKLYVATGATAQRLRESHYTLAQAKTKSWTEVVPPKAREWAPFPKENLDAWHTDAMAFFGDQQQHFLDMQQTLFNAPTLVYLTLPKNASYISAYDAGALGYGILLAAKDRGIRGVPAYELIRYPAEIHQEFEIPDDQAIFMGIALGYASDNRINQLETSRRKLADICEIKD